jgi:hypothetical protein
MPFSVTDILQPLDADTSASYKRSIEMAQALTAASTSSSYSIQRPSNNTTSASLCNSAFGPSSVHSSYYGPSSTTPFSANNQYYDYSTSFQNSGNSTGQYSPSSCWYGSAASMCFKKILLKNKKKFHLIYFSVSIFSWIIISYG